MSQQLSAKSLFSRSRSLEYASAMGAPQGPIWDFFYPGAKQNTSHYQAFCLGCIRHFRQIQGFQDPPNETDLTLLARIRNDKAAFSQGVSVGLFERILEALILKYLSARRHPACPRSEEVHARTSDWPKCMPPRFGRNQTEGAGSHWHAAGC
jgi:hypothetical protein